MQAAIQALCLLLSLDLGRAVGAVGLHGFSGIASIENIVELLAIAHARIGHIRLANDLVRRVDADVVLISVV